VFYLLASPVRLSFPAGGAAAAAARASGSAGISRLKLSAGRAGQPIDLSSLSRRARALSAASRSNHEARSSPPRSKHGGRSLAPARCATHLQASCTLTASRPLPGFPAACLPGPLVVLLSPYTTYVQDRTTGVKERESSSTFYPWSRDIWLDDQ
jgi:hypothetical protein